MFKKILVPTDASAHSRRALLKALELARYFNSKVELFYVLPQSCLVDKLGLNAIYTSEEEIETSGEIVFELTLKNIEIGGVVFEEKMTYGYPAMEILNELKNGFDLVVMGTRGHRPLTGAVIGSVTQRVAANAECPVVIIK